MDGDLSFLSVLIALGVVVGSVLGFVAGSALAAIWLRLAALWLRFGNVPYLTAFKSALLSSFVIFMLGFSVGVNQRTTFALFDLMNPEQESRSRDIVFEYQYPPMYFLYALVFGLLLTAAIFRRTIPNNDTDSRISFGDSLALASLYQALALACMTLIGLVALFFVFGYLSVMAP